MRKIYRLIGVRHLRLSGQNRIWLTYLSVVKLDFWGRVMGDYELVASTQRSCIPLRHMERLGTEIHFRTARELSRAIQKGIPSALRGMTWQLMA